ncbi:hypothetical protein HJ590_13040 [Naumannella sp. ID2617S]|nr:hypothetical protein [Naumannella sp. ID2617S]
MTATTQQQAPFGASEPPPGEPGRVRTRRQPRWIAAGLLAIALGGLGAALLWQQLVTTTEAVVVSHRIPRGEVIRSGDLRSVDVGSTVGVSTVPAAEIPALVGKRALVELPEGALLAKGSVGTPSLDRGASQVGLKLAPGRLPTGDLPVGTPVRLVPLEDPRKQPGQPASGPPVPVVTATVAAPPRTGPDGVAVLVDVRVDQSLAQQVAELAAAERLALVKEAGQ